MPTAAVLLAAALPLCADESPASGDAAPHASSDNAAQRVELDRPVSLFVRTADGESLQGRLVAYSLASFDLAIDGEAEPRQVEWSALEPQRAYAILSRLHEGADAAGWLRLGVAVRSWEGGEPFAERAFTRAERLDPALAERVARARRGEPIEPAEGAAAPEAPTPTPDEAGVAIGGPQTVGEVQADFWGPQTPEQQAAAIAQLNAFAAENLGQLGLTMRLFETKYFLFYTDLERREAEKWAGLLDKMYNRLCDLFAIDRGANIWRGKCLIFVFREQADFQRFETLAHRAPPVGLAGVCWQFGDGLVHVVFYRQPQEEVFAHVLVHESVHGFLHRYRSPNRIPSVWNEGLAEVIAAELVPGRVVEYSQRMAQTVLRETGSFGGMWDAPHIQAWHYGVASSLTALMIRENKRGYVDFINGIKDGLEWRQSLEEHYGVSLDKLVRYYGDQIKARNLSP